MIEKIVLAAILGLSPANKKALNNLQSRLKNKGYNISNYLKDPRFKVYKFENKKFINYSDTTKSWYTKRDSLEKCADFVEKYISWLKKGEKEFGPSPEYTVSQLQLESNLGQYVGSRPVINSLISTYLKKPWKRKQYYKFIVDFLELARDTTDNIQLPKDIFEIKGSWAGAEGIAQMMPDVLKKYGKISDFNGDGIFNPMSMPDAIGFIDRYLRDNGFDKNRFKAIQRYNKHHPFYGSSIIPHTIKLEEIMEKRSRIPPKKMKLFIPNSIPSDNPLATTNLKKMKSLQINPWPKKRPFIKRLLRRYQFPNR